MTEFIFFLVKASICQVAFWALLFLVDRRTLNLGVRRFYWIATLILSVLLPSFTLPDAFNDGGVVPMVNINQYTNAEFITDVSQTSPFTENLTQVFILAYVLIAAFFTLRMLYGIWHIFKIRRETTNDFLMKEKILLSSKAQPAFSFFGWVFVNPDLGQTTQELNMAIRHELGHARQLHSLDKLIVQLFIAMFWFNPVIYQIKKDLMLCLECLADREVYSHYPINRYIETLLSFKALPCPSLALSMIQHPIHSRIEAMLFQSKTKRKGLATPFPVLVLLVTGILFISMSNVEKLMVPNQPLYTIGIYVNPVEEDCNCDHEHTTPDGEPFSIKSTPYGLVYTVESQTK